MTDLNSSLEGRHSLSKPSPPSKGGGNGDVTRIAVRRIMKILGIIAIMTLLLGGGVVAPVVATQRLQLASMPPMKQHLTATLRLISILVSRHRKSEGNVVVIEFRRLPIEGLR